MDELDRKIEAALNEEDRAIHAKLGEQGVLGQWFGVYAGAARGLAVVATIAGVALFVAALYCGWRCLGASAAVDATRWGVAAALLTGMVGYLKLWFWLRMESNRVLREIRRLELLITRAIPR